MWSAITDLWRATAHLHAKTGRRAPAPSSSCPSNRHASQFRPERRGERSGLGESLTAQFLRFSGHFLIFVSSLLRIKAPRKLAVSLNEELVPTLLLLARYGKESQPQKMVPKVSQEMLAEMIGTTRTRVNFFMNKFRKLGFIRYNGGLHVHTSLLSVVLHE